MGSLVPMNEFLAKMAIVELRKEERHLRNELAEVSDKLKRMEEEYCRASAELLRHTAPLEREISFLLSELLRYGIRERHEYCRTPGDDRDITDYQSLYKAIARMLHCNGDYYSPEILNLAKDALKNNDFAGLFDAYERALHILRSCSEDGSCLSFDDDNAVDQSKKAVLGLRLLRKAIEARRSKLDNLARDPYYKAWRADSHHEYIEQACLQLRYRLHELETKIRDAKLYNPLGGSNEIFGQN